MFQINFTPKAASQYADIISFLEEYPGRLKTFEAEMDKIIEQLRKTPEIFSKKDKFRAARLRKSKYYVFFKIESEAKKVLVLLLIHQRQDPSNWPK